MRCSFTSPCGLPPFASALADAERVRGVKALDELTRERAIAREPAPSRLRGEELVEGAIGIAARAHAPHDVLETAPEIPRRDEPLAATLPTLPAYIGGEQPRLANDRHHLRRAPVHELGAELYRCGRARVAMREHPSTDAIACLEQLHTHAALAQRTRGSESGHTSAHDDDVRLVTRAQLTSGCHRRGRFCAPCRESIKIYGRRVRSRELRASVTA